MTTQTIPVVQHCANCGAVLEPPKVKRGEPKKYCNSTCRVEAFWKRKLQGPST